MDMLQTVYQPQCSPAQRRAIYRFAGSHHFKDIIRNLSKEEAGVIIDILCKNITIPARCEEKSYEKDHNESCQTARLSR